MVRTMNLALVLVIVALLSGPRAAEAQQAGKLPRIGFLMARLDSPHEKAFREGLRELGYLEGQNIVIDYRSTDGRDDAAPALMAELVRVPVDIIVTWTTPAALAAMRATNRIPIVAMTGDPVASGLAASLSRPGGNVTGVSILTDELDAKQLDLLRETVPGIRRVAVLSNPANPVWAAGFKKLETRASSLGLSLQLLEVTSARELEGAFATAARERAGALLVLRDNLFATHRRQLVELAARHRLPAMYGSRFDVEAGGLIAYEVDIRRMMRRLAAYVDRILRGAKPAELPIEQPTTFDFVINLKTAKALGLTIPPSVLTRVDEVIQ